MTDRINLKKLLSEATEGPWGTRGLDGRAFLHDKRNIIFAEHLDQSDAELICLLRNHIDGLLETLKFYADNNNYMAIHAENPAPRIVMDGGDRATEALKALEER